MPPSVLYIIAIVAHIPGSFSLAASFRLENEADWIDRRVRTISRGYVTVTEVMPAAPPHIRRLTAERSAPGVGSRNCTEQRVSFDKIEYDSPNDL